MPAVSDFATPAVPQLRVREPVRIGLGRASVLSTTLSVFDFIMTMSASQSPPFTPAQDRPRTFLVPLNLSVRCFWATDLCSAGLILLNPSGWFYPSP